MSATERTLVWNVTNEPVDYLFQCLNITEDDLDNLDTDNLDYSNCSYREVFGDLSKGIWGTRPVGQVGK